MENLSTAILCVLLAGACVYAVMSYRKKLKNGCCGGGDSEVQIKPANADPSHYPHKTVVYIDGMTCRHCKMHVENAFNKKQGCFARVHLHKHCAEVWSEQPLPEAEIRETVKNSGYIVVKSLAEK